MLEGVETWTARDLPVLRAVVERFTDTAEYLRADAYAELVPELAEDDVRGAIRRLSRAFPPYLDLGGEGASLDDDSGVPWAIFGVSERAMREVGQWPSPEEILRRIAEGMMAAAALEPDDEKANVGRRAATWVAGLASGTGSGVAAAALAKAFGVA